MSVSSRFGMLTTNVPRPRSWERSPNRAALPLMYLDHVAVVDERRALPLAILEVEHQVAVALDDLANRDARLA